MQGLWSDSFNKASFQLPLTRPPQGHKSDTALPASESRFCMKRGVEEAKGDRQLI